MGNSYQNGYIVKNSNDLFGLIDFTKKVLLEPKYEEIKQVPSISIYIVKENGKLNAINSEGEILLENKFDDVKEINENDIVFIKNKKYGLISSTGEIKIEQQYDDLQYVFNGYYIAKKADKYGIINTSNETILPFEYTNISYRKEAGFIEVNKDNQAVSQILNNKFEQKLEGIISEVNQEKGYFRIRINDEYKYYNFNFEEKKPSEVLSSNTLFLSKKDGKYGYTDKDGNVVIDYIYEDATEQNNFGYAAVKKDGKWGAIDKEGKIVAETQYNLDNNIIIDFIGKWHLGEDINSYYYTDK